MNNQQIRAALKTNFPGRVFKITKTGEIHELRTLQALRTRHWFLFAYTNSPELPLMLAA